MARRASFWAAVLAILLIAPAALPNEVRVLESSETEIVLELLTDEYTVEPSAGAGDAYVRVTAPGYAWTTEPGLPRLPLEGALVGVPFGSRVRLEILSVEAERAADGRVEPAPEESFERDGDFSVPVERFLPNDEFYTRGRDYPEAVAELGFDSVLRHQRVVQVLFYPFGYDARAERVDVRTRIVVRLDLRGGHRSPSLVPAVADEPEWEGIYAGTVVNYADARGWRMRKRPEGVYHRADARQIGETYRLTVRETGLQLLEFGMLFGQGLSSTHPIDEVGVYQRSFVDGESDPFVETPLPVLVSDENANGLFDGADYIIFYGQSFEDEFVEVGWEDRYGKDNVYWFGVGEDVARRMTTRPGWHDATGLTPPASFRDTLRFEEDVYYDASPPADAVDWWHWTLYYRNGDDYSMPFAVHDVDASGDILFRARYHGDQDGRHRIELSIVDGASNENAIGHHEFYGNSYTMNEHIVQLGPVPASYLTDGENTLHAVGEGGRSGANLDWFEFAYLRGYEAVDGRLAFTSGGETGLTEFRIGGFQSQTLLCFDVTDPHEPVAIELGSENVVAEGGGYTLVLQDEPDGFTRYVATQDGALISVPEIERREPANLFEREADLIVISYEGFAAGVEPLIEHRESQGTTVAHAMLEEVYDEFGGGMPSPFAIRNYLKYAFYEWDTTPQFAMLVGDASEDYRGDLLEVGDSDPDYVPTYVHVGVSCAGDLLSGDEWYVSFLPEAPFLPQMYIGRLPVGNAIQLDGLVSKILAYEDAGAGEDWRENVMFLADDQWSYVTLSSPYSKKASESGFTDVCLELAAMTGASPAEIDTTVYALRRYTDPWHGSTTSGDVMYAIETVGFVRGEPLEELFEMLNDGAILVNFQGHGNRTLLTHENLLRATDLPALANEGKPFIFFGFSCQLAQFHYWKEGKSGDCFTEQMLFLSPTTGAVAAFASSGEEYLSINQQYNRGIFEALFEDPAPDGPPESFFWPRWTLGGLLAKGTVKLLTKARPSHPARAYTLLGDPLLHIEMSPPTIKVTLNDDPILSGDYLDAESVGAPLHIVADIIDEVEIDPSSITLVETDVGEIPPGSYTLEAIVDSAETQETSRWYRLTYDTSIRDGSYDIRITASDLSGQLTRFVLYNRVGNEIRDVAAHPNPFDPHDGPTTLIYLLSKQSDDVTIRIFTVGGRLVEVIEGAPGNRNFNQVRWDGRDKDGDVVANGVYLYVIEAVFRDEATGGRTSVTSEVGRLLKMGGID